MCVYIYIHVHVYVYQPPGLPDLFRRLVLNSRPRAGRALGDAQWSDSPRRAEMLRFRASRDFD